MSKPDFTEIRLQHVAWKARLDDFFQGKGSMSENEAVSPKDCDVGRWLYSVGMKKYGEMPEMHELEKIHAELHSTVKKIILLKQSGKILDQEEESARLDVILRKIMFLLVEIEEKLA